MPSAPSYEVILIGNVQAEDMKKMITEIRKHYLPNKVVILRNIDEKLDEISIIANFILD